MNGLDATQSNLNGSQFNSGLSLSNAAFPAQSHPAAAVEPETPPTSLDEMYQVFLQMKSHFNNIMAEKDKTIATLTKRVVSLEESAKKVAKSTPPNGSSSVDEKVITEMKKEYSDNMNTIKATVAAQQKTLENLQQEKRAKNVIITGVPEPEGSPLEIRKKDESTVESIFTAVNCPGVCASRVTRLGRPRNTLGNDSNTVTDAPPPRPLLVTLNTVADARAVTTNRYKLKQNNTFSKVYLKKDEHPLIRKEWNRLRAFAKTEKAAPINVACNIKVDYQKKAVTRNGESILEFVSPFRGAGPNQ